jgi:protein-disulfide isomerase
MGPRSLPDCGGCTLLPDERKHRIPRETFARCLSGLPALAALPLLLVLAAGCSRSPPGSGASSALSALGSQDRERVVRLAGRVPCPCGRGAAAAACAGRKAPCPAAASLEARLAAAVLGGAGDDAAIEEACLKDPAVGKTPSPSIARVPVDLGDAPALGPDDAPDALERMIEEEAAGGLPRTRLVKGVEQAAEASALEPLAGLTAGEKVILQRVEDLRDQVRALQAEVRRLGSSLAERLPSPPGHEPAADLEVYPIGGDEASLGDDGARVALVAFVDYASKATASFHREVCPALRERWVGPGKLRVLVRHIAPAGSPESRAAAAAASCALEGGAFWEFHDGLLAADEKLGRDLYRKVAARAKLDVFRFLLCMGEGGEARSRRDGAVASRLGVRSAPSFLLGYVRDRGSERVVEVLSRLPAESALPAFSASIEDLLELRARHILLETEEEASRARAGIEAAGGGPDAFAEAARRLSKDALTKRAGGDLGPLRKNPDVERPLAEAALGLRVGEVSAPVRTGAGWHLVHREETRGRLPGSAPEGAGAGAPTSARGRRGRGSSGGRSRRRCRSPSRGSRPPPPGCGARCRP